MTAAEFLGAQPAVLITGCSSGIGRESALDLVRRGWLVFAGVRSKQDGLELTQAVGNKCSGDSLRTIQLDITSQTDIDSAAEQIGGAMGERGLSGLVNNAGIVVPGPLELVTTVQLRQQFEVNVIGTHAVTRALLPQLRIASGRIVFVGSISGRVAPPFYGAYAASKHALEAIADAWRVELRAWRIAVSIIEPDSVSTPIWNKVSSGLSELSDDSSSPSARHYAEQLRSTRRNGLVNRESGLPPALVVDAVRHALTSGSPRARYPVGLRTRAAFWAKNILPVSLFDYVLRKSVGCD